MDILISPSFLKGRLTVPASKSDAHRLLIAAALSKSQTIINLNGFSKDIDATVSCLEALGCRIVRGSDTLTVNPVWQGLRAHPVLHCGESGSTLRFLLPVAAALCAEFTMTGEGRLPGRPMAPLTGQMTRNGCRFEPETLPFKVTGPLRGGLFELPGNISSQFVSGLLFALPLLKEDSEIVLTSPLESAGYADMTLAALEKFGIRVSREENRFAVPGGRTYASPGEAAAEGDWSNAAFWLVAGAVNGGVACEGLDTSSRQPDKAIVQLLERMGADITVKNQTVTARAGKLKGIRADISETPDLAPVLAVAAAFAEGTTVFENAGRLRLKESDRLSAIASNLKALGARAELEGDALVIHGEGTLRGGAADGFNDHRMVMAAAVAGTACETSVEIRGAGAVGKSYPRFFEDLKQLGGKADVV